MEILKKLRAETQGLQRGKKRLRQIKSEKRALNLKFLLIVYFRMLKYGVENVRLFLCIMHMFLAAQMCAAASGQRGCS